MLCNFFSLGKSEEPKVAEDVVHRLLEELVAGGIYDYWSVCGDNGHKTGTSCLVQGNVPVRPAGHPMLQVVDDVVRVELE